MILIIQFSSCVVLFLVVHAFIMPTVHLLDYVAGNIRSLVNAIEKVGYEVEWIRSPEDVPKADVCLPCIFSCYVLIAH